MAKKNQSTRLTTQHKESKGVVGIFGEEAKLHDLTVGEISNLVITQLEKEYPQLTFRFNTNLCENKFVQHKNKTIMLQATSIYTQGKGEKWNNKEMFDIMIEISKTSLKVLGSDLFNQITKK